MDTYLLIKQWHVVLALLSLSGFVWRGVLMLQASRLLQTVWVRRVPHAIDSGLFLLGLSLLWLGPWSLGKAPWLQLKLALLLLYIGLGFVALHRGRFARRTRVLAWSAALAVFSGMLVVAHSKPAWPL